MMHAFIRGVILFLSFYTVLNNMINLGIQDPDHFGPYILNYTRFDFCSGPRSNNLTTTTFTLRYEGLKFYGHFNMTFLVPTHIDEVKIVVYSVKDEKIGNVLWTYKLNDPCKHFAIANLINNSFKTANCIVNKGTYFQIINFEEVSSKFFGTSFFYGKFFLKTTLISKKGNLMCLVVGMVFTKKSVSKS